MPPRRADAAPLLTPRDVPALRPDLRDVSAVFNPGAALWRGREVLLLRVQTRGRTTLLLPAERHPDGRLEILGPSIDVAGLERLDPRPAHVYDPRLTVLDDVLHATLAADFAETCRLVTARTDDFVRWELVGIDAEGDRRNGVLFPERVGGQFARLQRPNETRPDAGPRTGDRITLAVSDDLVTWRETGEVFRGRPQFWDELVGPGPPPVKTLDGWLLVYHGVATHFGSASVYQAGAALLDLADPSRVLSRGAFNILEPRRSWELTGQVPNVVFPSGLVVERFDAKGFAEPQSPVRIYYGAADTVVGLAVTTVAELIEDARFAG